MSAYEAMMHAVERWKHLGIKTGPGSAIAIGHMPDVARFAYVHRINPGLAPELLREAQARLPVTIPSDYAEFLSHCNGAQLFGFQLQFSGVRLVGRTGNIDDLFWAPSDIVTQTALDPWSRKFNFLRFSVWPDATYIYMRQDQTVVRLSHEGRTLDEWPSLEVWIAKQFAHLETQHDPNGRPLIPPENVQLLPSSNSHTSEISD